MEQSLLKLPIDSLILILILIRTNEKGEPTSDNGLGSPFFRAKSFGFYFLDWITVSNTFCFLT